jgi:hypothetical protein
MAGGRGIKMRINRQRVEALADICTELATGFKPADEHQYLLWEYLHDLKHRLAAMLQQRQERYTLLMTGAEQTAFYQLWHLPGADNDRYTGIIVKSILDGMEQCK